VSTSQKIAVAGATARVGHHVVDVLTERGHEVVPISRSGVDVITAEGSTRRWPASSASSTRPPDRHPSSSRRQVLRDRSGQPAAGG
jgi:nucleoside-diphosphate-sugar epimerase